MNDPTIDIPVLEWAPAPADVMINTSVRQTLTARQARVLDFIVSSRDARGYPPTVREIGKHMGIKSTNGVTDHLRALERKGAIVRSGMTTRGLRVLRGVAPVHNDPAEMSNENARLRDLLREAYRVAGGRAGWKLDGLRAAISKEFAAMGAEL